LTEGEINKWNGPFSRVAGLYLLSRHEKVVVSDFYSSLVDLKPWIPPDHPLYALTVDELYRYLVRRYLRPRADILAEVDHFYDTRLGSPDFIAVHARGSDKVKELLDLDAVNRHYRETIDRLLAAHDCRRIFLMTDDQRLLEYFADIYRGRITATECQRTGDATGIHYQTSSDKRRLGKEIMVDTYMAIKARAFVGNNLSNPSQMVRYLKDWPEGTVHLIGPNIHHVHHLPLHDWNYRPAR